MWGLIGAEIGSRRILATQHLRLFGPDGAWPTRDSFRVEVWTIGYTYFMDVELLLSMVLILLAGPNLISQDLRFNAMPLYFSRPLRRIDYFLGKLGVIGTFSSGW